MLLKMNSVLRFGLGICVCLCASVWGNDIDIDYIETVRYEDAVDLSKIGTIADLCTKISTFANVSECEKQLSGPPVDGDKTLVSQDYSVALFDACNPREQTVALPRGQDPRITVWPICTRVKRCGGCCTSDVFTCSPTKTRKKWVKVFKTLLPYPGAHTFKFLGMTLVALEEHTQCDAQCKIKQHNCHKYQIYEPRKCRCRCRQERLRLKHTCTENQVWDDNECNCICPGRNTIFCPEPSVFSETTCKCTLKTSVTGEIDLEKLFEQIDKGLFGPQLGIGQNPKETEKTDYDVDGLGNTDETDLITIDGEQQIVDAEGPTTEELETTTETETTEPTTSTTTATTTTTTPTTTTPTTTTPEQTTVDPCFKKSCFGVWKPRRMKNGLCLCMPPSGGSIG